ncbi:MAG TPA: hypothetical protein DDX71_08005 [Ruminococcus sp.]|nr:hypothetical protein [Ruminococcus sp.]
MMIDASLGRGGCCGYPACPQNPAPFPPQPTPPLPVTEPDALNIRVSTALTAVADGAVLPLNGTVRTIGNGLAYDTANHAFTVNEAGVYLIAWQVLVQSAAGDAADAVIALQSLDGQTVLAVSGASGVPAAGAALVSGTTVAQLPAGTSWVLVNLSGAAVNIPAAGTAPAAFSAALTVTEIGG